MRKYDGFRKFQELDTGQVDQDLKIGSSSVEPVEEQSPTDQIETNFKLINDSLATQLLDTIKANSPKFFERLVVELLSAMGYGANQNLEESVVGKIGDKGIDGMINQDPLGLNVVYMQAKRYTVNTVPISDLRNFVGALSLKGATTGIFATTSKFPPAEEIKDGPFNIVLIDGERLARLLIEYRVGVTVKKEISICKIDKDYFDEVT